MNANMKTTPHGRKSSGENDSTPDESQKIDENKDVPLQSQTMDESNVTSDQIPNLDRIKAIMRNQGLDADFIFRFVDHVGKVVKVKDILDEIYQGRIKCMDPFTGNFFLDEFDDTLTKVIGTTLICNDGVSTMEVLEDGEDIKKAAELLSNVDKSLPGTSGGILGRKLQLLAWIKFNRLPVYERFPDEALVVCQNVIIEPPYEVQNCSSPNGITLASVHKLVKQFDKEVTKQKKDNEDDDDEEDDEDDSDVSEEDDDDEDDEDNSDVSEEDDEDHNDEKDEDHHDEVDDDCIQKRAFDSEKKAENYDEEDDGEYNEEYEEIEDKYLDAWFN